MLDHLLHHYVHPWHHRQLGYAAASFELNDRPNIEDILSGVGSLAALRRFFEFIVSGPLFRTSIDEKQYRIYEISENAQANSVLELWSQLLPISVWGFAYAIGLTLRLRHSVAWWQFWETLAFQSSKLQRPMFDNICILRIPFHLWQIPRLCLMISLGLVLTKNEFVNECIQQVIHYPIFSLWGFDVPFRTRMRLGYCGWPLFAHLGCGSTGSGSWPESAERNM